MLLRTTRKKTTYMQPKATENVLKEFASAYRTYGEPQWKEMVTIFGAKNKNMIKVCGDAFYELSSDEIESEDKSSNKKKTSVQKNMTDHYVRENKKNVESVLQKLRRN
ncbi:hypothetical protein ABFX02_14G203100 [Erythranthe guttata]